MTNNLHSPTCATVLRMWGFHWSMVDLKGAISLKKTDSPTLRNHSLSAVPQQGMRPVILPDSCCSVDWLDLMLVLCRPPHSWEFVTAEVLSCLEDAVLYLSSPNSGSCNLMSLLPQWSPSPGNFLSNQMSSRIDHHEQQTQWGSSNPGFPFSTPPHIMFGPSASRILAKLNLWRKGVTYAGSSLVLVQSLSLWPFKTFGYQMEWRHPSCSLSPAQTSFCLALRPHTWSF